MHTQIIRSGQPAPGTSANFDAFIFTPNGLNDAGDVTFGAHVAGEECLGGDSSTIGCFTSLYLYRSSTGRISSVAHQGDPALGWTTAL